MITALIVLFASAVSFALGVTVATVRAKRVMDRVENELFEELGYTSKDMEEANEKYANALKVECHEHDAPPGKFCFIGEGWVCEDRVAFAGDLETRGYDYVVSSTASPGDPGDWIECGISNKCGHGCKIYRNTKTGTRILWHNAAYGCKQ
jgi:hypothetical protein